MLLYALPPVTLAMLAYMFVMASYKMPRDL